MGLCGAFLLVGALRPLPAQPGEAPAATAEGTRITGTFASPGGEPFFAAGLHLSTTQTKAGTGKVDPLASNVVGLSCGTGSTTKLAGGPDGSPECLCPAAVASSPFVLTGQRPWADVLHETDPDAQFFLVQDFYSLDNSTYVFRQPGSFMVVSLPAANPPGPITGVAAPVAPQPAPAIPAPAPAMPSFVDEGGGVNWLP